MAKKKTPKKPSNQMPEWARQPFQSFLDYTKNLDYLLRLSIKGISALRGMPGLVEALGKNSCQPPQVSTDHK